MVHDVNSAMERADRLVAKACAYLEVPREVLNGRGRDREVAAARQVVCYLLHRAGYSAAQIGARVGRDHSTVLYALRRVEQSPALAEQAAELIETVLPFLGEEGSPAPTVGQALSRVVLRAILGLVGLREVRAVRAYVLGSLLACEHVDAIRAAMGLMVLAERPKVRTAVEEALATCGLSAYAGLIPLHLRQAGVMR